MLVAVVLPCLPATATLPPSERMRARAAARGTTGTERRRASRSSGFVEGIAVEITTCSASPFCSAAWPMYTVTPISSSLKESSYTWRLEEMGVTVYIGHAAEQIGDAEQVVISTAIPSTNPELLEARRRSIPIVPRAAALAQILADGRSIAIAGTHGKTTTTSMTTHALRALGERPTALIGGELNDIGSNVVSGGTDLFIAEADESDRSLLYLKPEAAAITNVEFDHPDFYSSLDDVLETFKKFVKALPPEGHLVAYADDANCAALTTIAPCPVTTYGLSAGDLC